MQKPLYSLILLTTLLRADGFYNSQSFQGFTGIINTPNAEVLEEGKTELQISNQVDVERVRDRRDKYRADQYMVNFGILPNFEFGGRLSNTEYKDTTNKIYEWITRDLSASFKYQIPFYHEYLPKIAIGIQDLGGQADNYDAKYIVASKEYKFLRGSIGYSIDSDRMNGVFGGIEAKATDWATLLAEYDSQETHVGVRLNAPDSFSNYFDISLLAKANLDDDKQRFAFALNLKIEIGDNHHTKEIINTPHTEVETSVPPTPTGVSKTTPPLNTLKEKLVNFGFENIDIGSRSNTIYVAYENNILDHNELDALGVILGYMVKLDAPYKNFEIIIKRSNQKVRQVSGDLEAYKNVIKNMSPFALRDFKNSIEVQAVSHNKQTNLIVKGANSSYLKTRVELYPGLKSFIGTELGTFDYLLSVRTYLLWNLYKGFDLGVLYDFPFMWSDDLNKEHGGYRQYHNPSELKSILLHRSDVIGDFINIASIGIHGDNWAGFESLTYTMGNHTLSAKLGYLEAREKEYWQIRPETKRIYLGTYSYYSDKFDTIAEYTYGQFYNADYGFEVKAKRYFGDVAIGLLYQQTTQKYVGISAEIPLTPRRVSNSWFQIKGKNDFSYQVRTTVMDDDGATL